MSSVDSLSEEQIQNMKETFRLFDKTGRDQISTSDLGTVIRSLGQNPTEAELAELISEINGKETVDFTEFLSLMVKQMQVADTANDIKDAFKVFDKNSTGEISAADLKHILTTIGEKLSEEDVDLLLKDGNIVDQNGKIHYDSFVQLMMSNDK